MLAGRGGAAGRIVTRRAETGRARLRSPWRLEPARFPSRKRPAQTEREACVSRLICAEGQFQIRDAHNHGSLGIERKILKSPPCIKSTYRVVDRLGKDTKTTDILSEAQRRPQRKEEKGTRVPLTLVILMNGKLAKK